MILTPKTSQEKVQRVQRVLADVDRQLFAIKMSKEPPTRTTLLTLLACEGLLERAHSSDLADFGQKRAHNLIETALKERRQSVEATLGDEGRSLGETFVFARRAVELGFQVAVTRLDASSFDASPLGALPINPVAGAANHGVKLSRVCQEIDGRLDQTRPLDGKVRGWGLKNLSALVTNRDPLDFPAELVSGGFGVLGAIVGRGPASKRASAATQFKLLGDSFRERLYLLAANSILLRRSSLVSQAEEAWRKHLAGEAAARWEKLRRHENDVLAFFLGPIPELGAKFDEALQELARRARSSTPGGLVPLDKLDDEDMETLARAYFLIYDAVVTDVGEGDDSKESPVVWDTIARSVVERRPGGSVDPIA
ncbi:MAG: hypothetical protein ACAI25_05440, partial [Planctomycetota bacterium]